MTTTFLKTLQGKLQEAKPKTLRGRTNLIGKVLSYGEVSIEVEVMSGPIAGQTIKIGLPKTSSFKAKMKDFTTPSNAQMSMHTEVGGLLRFENVEKDPNDDERYKCGWINTWQKKAEDPDLKMLFDQQVKLNVLHNVKTSSGYPMVRAQVFEPGTEIAVDSVDAVTAALTKAYAEKGAAIIGVVNEDGYAEMSTYLPGEKKGDKYILQDPKEYAEKLVASICESDEARADLEAQAAAGNIVILPCMSVSVGGKTAEAIVSKMDDAEKKGTDARVMSVNPYAYDTRNLGSRMAVAMMMTREGEQIISKEDQNRLAEAFKKSLPEDTRDLFADKGWGAMSDGDIRRFFEAQGVTLKDHPSEGYANAQLKLQKYRGGDDYFLASSLEMSRFAQPYPNIEATKDLRQGYAFEMVNASKDALDKILDRSAEKDAPKAAAGTDEPEREAPATASEEDIDAIENLLDAELGDL